MKRSSTDFGSVALRLKPFIKLTCTVCINVFSKSLRIFHLMSKQFPQKSKWWIISLDRVNRVIINKELLFCIFRLRY